LSQSSYGKGKSGPKIVTGLSSGSLPVIEAWGAVMDISFKAGIIYTKLDGGRGGDIFWPMLEPFKNISGAINKLAPRAAATFARSPKLCRFSSTL
jgi:hypothetical protein